MVIFRATFKTKFICPVYAVIFIGEIKFLDITRHHQLKWNNPKPICELNKF